ncbi:DUF4091 domain-containing protein [Paenibacillus sp. PL91]|uniref:DUF4091 domain-containing protein n=1 Tax=Paenibacillus sp. PL91 TaxID=2729538 RepID=UPI00145E27B6|nr:DUF4091 domain-containing protein [Paenibacillus sp. PL91]MBC9200778.1 DUF4091 domain-containing protein [Paenibacillus sp. PL91]
MVSAWLETKCVSSLAKVFPDEELTCKPFSRASVFKNEIFSFQVAYRAQHVTRAKRDLKVRMESGLAHQISIKSVGLAPSELPCYPDQDEHILRSAPGLYPDPLFPMDTNRGVHAIPQQWRSLWITVALDGSAEAGVYPIRIAFQDESDSLLSESTIELEIINAELPKQKLLHTEWFHTDCLATHYNVEMFGDAHWVLIEKYVSTAVQHGMNMLLTPLFTPPLDTKEGGERPTVQLIDVEKQGDRYTFGFDQLKQWVELGNRCGVQYFEFSHLFTQWGAKHAPKILATEDGKLTRIFGWETDAAGESYKGFLRQFLPALVRFIETNNLESRSYFHISDEPSIEHIPWYTSASEIMKEYLGKFPMIDALSDYTFYEQGLISNPIPANDHIEPFLANGVENLWTYYCCAQYKQVSNRFFSMPSARNRMIGMQMYKFNIAGFLHWGYNFWYSQYSIAPIEPFETTDAGCAFPSGDAFLVYPGLEGPIESIRLKVFYEALQDMRALELLEGLAGRAETLKLLEEGLANEITFDVYPRDLDWLLSRRERINQTIKSLIK